MEPATPRCTDKWLHFILSKSFIGACTARSPTRLQRCFSASWRANLQYISMLLVNHFFTQLSIPTHAQFQRHRLKFIKNHLKTPTCFGLRPSSGSYNVLAKITII